MDKVKIKISHALKQYGNNVIIPDLSVVIEEGELFFPPGTVWLWKDNITENDRRIQHH